MSRAPINSGRYVLIATNGTRQWARDQVALKAEILTLLEQEGALPKKRIIMKLSTAQAAIETALKALLNAGKIEHYRAMSARRRMDEHWCLAGMAPVAPLGADGSRYNAVAILTAMQQHAVSLHMGVQR